MKYFNSYILIYQCFKNTVYDFKTVYVLNYSTPNRAICCILLNVWPLCVLYNFYTLLIFSPHH
jgi:hypothetical protein